MKTQKNGRKALSFWRGEGVVFSQFVTFHLGRQDVKGNSKIVTKSAGFFNLPLKAPSGYFKNTKKYKKN